MAIQAPPRIEFCPAILDDLMRVEGKAELVAGRIIHQVASGFDPSQIAFEIAVDLRRHARGRGEAYAFADGIGYALQPPLSSGRQSFSPDASFHSGPRPTNAMRFIEGTPIFAVEVRNENDYGPRAEAEMLLKRADYFEAGTIVVWDVDPEARTVAAFVAGDPATPSTTYRPGDTADAEPALPGWRLVVADIFR